MLTAYGWIALNILSIFICYQIAKERGGDARFWGWMGVLLGPFALPFVFFCKPKKQEKIIVW